jgi:hypothetical protein
MQKKGITMQSIFIENVCRYVLFIMWEMTLNVNTISNSDKSQSGKTECTECAKTWVQIPAPLVSIRVSLLFLNIWTNLINIYSLSSHPQIHKWVERHLYTGQLHAWPTCLALSCYMSPSKGQMSNMPNQLLWPPLSLKRSIQKNYC